MESESPPQSGGPPDELELRDYLQVLRRRKWFVIVTTLLVVAVALGVSLTRTPQYRATASVLLELPPQPETAIIRDLSPRQVENALQIAQSRTVQEQARDAVGEDAGLSVRLDTDADVLEFTATSPDPDVAATAANAYAGTFVEERRTQTLTEYASRTEVLDERIAEIDQQVEELRADQRAAEAQLPADASEQQLLDAGERFQSEINSLLSQRNGYVSEREALGLSIELLDTAGTRVIDPATPPSSPFEPDVARNAVVALVVGLIFGVGLAFLVEYLDTTLRSEEDLAHAAKVPVLAAVPRLDDWRDPAQPRIVVREAPLSPSAEAYRALRASLQFVATQQTLRVVQITSPRPGDGKTTTAVNLALVLARAGLRTALVDADLRKPRVHAFFGLPNDQGFTDALLGGTDMQVRAIDGEPHLRVLPSGPVPADPTELLSSRRARTTLEAMAEHFDVVVVDSSPVLAVADPLDLSKLVDGVLLVASASSTDRRQVAKAVEALRRVDAPLVGAVLNQLGAKASKGYGYGYGYGYGGYYGDGPPQPNGDAESTSPIAPRP